MWKLEWFSHLERAGWNTTVRSTLQLTSTADKFRIQESITAIEDGKVVADRSWDNTLRRDLM
jgi:hypothetical protein